MNKKPSYFFDFALGADHPNAHLIDLDWISQKLKLKPTYMNRKGDKRENFTYRFTTWVKYSKTHRGWNIDEDFEKFLAIFQKREKQIKEILERYKEYGIYAHFCFVPTFYSDSLDNCILSLKTMEWLSKMKISFQSHPQLSPNIKSLIHYKEK